MESSKINVLHTIETTGPGGAENVLISLATGLDKKKFKSFVCLRNEGWLKDELDRRGVKTFIIEEKRFFDVRFLLKVLFLVIREKISLIHAHEFGMGVYGSIIGSITARPVVTTIHGRNYYWENARRRTLMRLISRLGKMITVSYEQRSYIQDKAGINSKALTTIYNGINIQRYAKNVSNRNLKNELGISEKSIVVGTVGNLYPVKGHTFLIKAIPYILKEYNTVFILIGRGMLENELRNEAKELGIEDSVFFLGFRNDVASLLDMIDIFVLPSIQECLSLAVLEAMAKGIPAVVTDVGGNKEIIDNGKTGIIVPPMNTDALTKAMLSLLKNPQLAKSIGSAAANRIRNEFSEEQMIHNYEALYLSLCGIETKL